MEFKEKSNFEVKKVSHCYFRDTQGFLQKNVSPFDSVVWPAIAI